MFEECCGTEYDVVVASLNQVMGRFGTNNELEFLFFKLTDLFCIDHLFDIFDSCRPTDLNA